MIINALLNHFDTTICAPATSSGAGAVSIIRVSGPKAIEICSSLVVCIKGELASAKGYTLHFGTIYDKNRQVVDEVLVSVFRAPHSYTGEDSVEISCHASSYIVSRIIQLLIDKGCIMAQPGEFTKRAFINGKMDLSQAEAVSDLITSTSAEAHKIAVNQLKGGISKELSMLRGKILEATALLELELDFSEEDVEFADRKQLRALIDNTRKRCSTLADSFRQGNAIKNGIPTVIVGEPNSGKSTLLNLLVGGERAIVSEIPGTTRDTIEETMNLGGICFRFIDTAGVRNTDQIVEQMGIERTIQNISKALVVLLVADCSKGPDSVRNALSNVLSSMDLSDKYLIVIQNKADLLANFRPLPTSEPENETQLASAETGIKAEKAQALMPVEVGIKAVQIQTISMSALTGKGKDTLENLLIDIGQKICNNSDSDNIMVANIRHYEALRDSQNALQRVLTAMDLQIPSDLIAQDLRDAISHLGTITGEITNDEVLGEIFGKFCIGK